MDTTNQYIKMCGKALEIQKLFPNQIGNYVAGMGGYAGFNCEPEPNPFDELVDDIEPLILQDTLCTWGCYKYHTTANFGNGYGSCILFRSVVWLPRQDDLQNIIKSIRPMCNTWVVQAEEFYNFMQTQYELRYPPMSFEQMWLVFTMSECYNLVWNGTDWVVNNAIH